MRHPPADPVQIKTQPPRRVQQPARSVIHFEASRFRFLENSMVNQDRKHCVQDRAVALRHLRQLFDSYLSIQNMLGDAKRRHDVQTPRRAKIAQGVKIDH
jgi:hypothetical protein